jgi:adenylate kinase
MAHPAINEPFSSFGASSKMKLLLLGSPGPDTDLMGRIRSLHIEHVSPPTKPGEISHQSTLALMRKWFFGRKPDAGFVLTDFPATLLQAKVFDEWLDARGETLNAVFAFAGSPAFVTSHYRDLGLLAEDIPSA